MEVTFDHRRVCYVNGQPFFPIGLYPTYGASLDRINARAQEVGLPAVGIEETLKSLKEHGFNVAFHTWGMPDEADLEVAQKLGLYVLPEVGAPDDATLERYVALANRFNNVLMWYGIDEPSGERLQRAMDAHAATPPRSHRPVSAAINHPRLAADAAAGLRPADDGSYFIGTRPSLASPTGSTRIAPAGSGADLDGAPGVHRGWQSVVRPTPAGCAARLTSPGPGGHRPGVVCLLVASSPTQRTRAASTTGSCQTARCGGVPRPERRDCHRGAGDPGGRGPGPRPV